jgi:acyl-CoA synthetase (AMP-forming)/AMP-acid ligase II
MTENGVATCVPVDRPDLAAAGSVGIAAPWREIRLVDSEGNDVVDGEVGEAWTAGPGQLHGCYRKTMANRESFVGKWFRTGDLMRLAPDGGYYLVGRLKDMIKRAGENMSAAEVESCLSAIDGVAYAAVVSVPDDARGEEVKAYVELQSGVSANDVPLEAVFVHCAERFAAFKVPRYLAYVEDIPMTASNYKVAKAQLVGDDDLRLGAYDRVDGVWR